MSASNQADNAVKSNWGLHSLRFTFFATPGAGIVGADLFQSFFNVTADAETHRKAEFLSEFATQKGPVNYQVVMAGPKVDFLVTVAVTPESLQAGFPVLPAEVGFESRFCASATDLVTKTSNIVRVAVGANYVESVANKDEGYGRLARYIPGIKLDASCSDFQFRINRPRCLVFAKQQVRFNRLSTWSCQWFRVGIEVAGGMSSESNIGSVVSVITDINTDPAADISKFDVDVKQNVIQKLFEFSKEIPERGDVS